MNPENRIEFTFDNTVFTVIANGNDPIFVRALTTWEDRVPRKTEERWCLPNGKPFNLGELPNKIVHEYAPVNKVYSYWIAEDGQVAKESAADISSAESDNSKSSAAFAENQATETSNIQLVKELQEKNCTAEIPREILNDIGLVLPSTALRRRPGQYELELQCGKLCGTDLLVPLSTAGYTCDANGKYEKSPNGFAALSCVRSGNNSMMTVNNKIPINSMDVVDGYVVIFGWDGTSIKIDPAKVWKIARRTRVIEYGAVYAIYPYVTQADWNEPKCDIPKDTLICYPYGTKLVAFKRGDIRTISGMTGGLYVDNFGARMIHIN